MLGIRVGFIRSELLAASAAAPPAVPSPSQAPPEPPRPSPSPQAIETPALTPIAPQLPLSKPAKDPVPAALFVHVGGGGTDAIETNGGAFVAGAGVRYGPVIALFTPADVIFTPASTYPYYRDSFDNGQSRCRNSLNEQFASDESCIAYDVTNAMSAEALLVVPRTFVAVGGGRRFGASNDAADLWFGSAGVAWLPLGRLSVLGKVNFGEDYLSGIVTVGLRLRHAKRLYQNPFSRMITRQVAAPRVSRPRSSRGVESSFSLLMSRPRSGRCWPPCDCRSLNLSIDAQPHSVRLMKIPSNRAALRVTATRGLQEGSRTICHELVFLVHPHAGIRKPNLYRLRPHLTISEKVSRPVHAVTTTLSHGGIVVHRQHDISLERQDFGQTRFLGVDPASAQKRGYLIVEALHILVD